MSLIAKVLAKSKRETKPEPQIAPGILHLSTRSKKREWQRYILFFLPVLAALLGYFLVQYVTKQTEPLIAPSKEERHRINPEPLRPEVDIKVADIAQQSSQASTKEEPVAQKEDKISESGSPPSKADLEKEGPQKSMASVPKERKVKGYTKSAQQTSRKELTKRPAQIKREGEQGPKKAEEGEAELITKRELERDFHIYQARALEEQHNPMEALEHYKKAATLDKDNYKLHNKIAALCIKLKDPVCAQEYVNKAIQARPDYVPALLNKGIALALEGRDQEAEETFMKVKGLEPYNKTALINLGRLYEKRGDMEKAYEAYKALYDANEPEGILGMGRVFESTGRYQEAVNYYGRLCNALNVDPGLKRFASERLNLLIPLIQDVSKN